MYEVSTPEAIVLDRARKDPRAAARIERMLAAVQADQVVETDDAGLADLMERRGWLGERLRTGQHRMARQPALIFNAFRWPDEAERDALIAHYPGLARHLLLGLGAWSLRDAARFRREKGCVCQTAWEIHCAYGCLHACDYCHIPPYFNIMANLEQLAERVRGFGEAIPDQALYKFDNYTDTITLEPEYGASEVMVNAFADWEGRYLLLYTKSDNVDHLLGLDHGGHTLISWSLGSDTVAEKIEKRTPSPDARIAAMEKCEKAGYPVRVRISPICPVKGWREEYASVIERLLARVSPEVVSVDVVGWMSAAAMEDALDVSLFDEEYAREVARLKAENFRPNGKHLFPHRMRADILRFAIEKVRAVRPGQRVSLCMETEAMWRELGPLTGMSPERYACCCGPDSVPGQW